MSRKPARPSFLRSCAIGLSALGISALALGFAGSNAWAKGDKLWFHLNVSSPTDSEHVHINLPLSVAEALLPSISSEHLDSGHLKLDLNGHRMTVDDLRSMWTAAKDIEDGEFITVESKGDEVHISRSGEFMLVNADDHESKVEIKVPIKVVDAILSGQGDELDLEAGMKALREHGPGDLLTVTDGDESVHIWIDSKSTSDD